MKILKIFAQCNDCFAMELQTEGVAPPTLNYSGYVPKWFPNPDTRHFGDSVALRIDLETGQILNWKKPTDEDLQKTFPVNPTTT